MLPPSLPIFPLPNLDLDPLERQALLEREGVRARCRGLIQLLEMKATVPGSSWKGRSAH